jgi:hypothetical protein
MMYSGGYFIVWGVGHHDRNIGAARFTIDSVHFFHQKALISPKSKEAIILFKGIHHHHPPP